jgi:hypothetical protein
MKRKRAKRNQPDTKRWKNPRNSKQYSALGEDKQDIWSRIVHAISRMRSDKLSLQKASKEAGVSSRKVASLGRSALRKNARGRYTVKPNDHLLRVLIIPGPDGLQEVAVNDSDTASEIARYSDAVQKYLRTGDASKLRQYTRMRLIDADGNPIQLVTDLPMLRRLGSAGVLSFESLYARVG